MKQNLKGHFYMYVCLFTCLVFFFLRTILMENFPLKGKCLGLNTITRKCLALSSLLTSWKRNLEWIWINTSVRRKELFPEPWQKWWRSTCTGKLAWQSWLRSCAVRSVSVLVPGCECLFSLAENYFPITNFTSLFILENCCCFLRVLVWAGGNSPEKLWYCVSKVRSQALRLQHCRREQWWTVPLSWFRRVEAALLILRARNQDGWIPSWFEGHRGTNPASALDPECCVLSVAGFSYLCVWSQYGLLPFL